jgi:hypothetical protein
MRVRLRKETVRSVRFYLLFAGVVALAAGTLNALTPLPRGVRVLGLVSAGFGTAFLWVGIAIRRLLARAPQLVVRLLVATLFWLLVLVLAGLPDADADYFIFFSFAGLVTLHLLGNVRRLAREARKAGPTG